MKIAKYSDVPAEEVTIEGAKGVKVRWLISSDDGATNFAMRLFEVQPGGCTPFHSHPHEHEVFVVEGTGVVSCDGSDYDLEREQVVFVPGGAEHQFRNTGDGLLRFLCIIPIKSP